MDNELVIHKHRTMVFPFRLSFDVTDESFSSEIRKGTDHNSPLIATWDISKDPENPAVLIFSLDDSVTGEIVENVGYMDIKRISNEEPLPVLASPLLVRFKEVITL